MAEEANVEAATQSDASGGGPSKLPLILGAVNTLVVLAAVGAFAYTRLLYHRPQITEQGERTRLESLKSSPGPGTTSGFVNFEPMTINIAPSVPQTKTTEGDPASQTNGQSGQIQGKLHYATIGFSLQLQDVSRSTEVEALRPLILDQFLGLVGRKQFQDLTSIEGRYVLKTQLIEMTNELAKKRLSEGPNARGANTGPLVSNIYFNQFIVQ